MSAPLLFTIGHSTRALDDLLALLRAHSVRCLADVRRWPRSRRHPHFTADALAPALAAHDIAYRHFPDLGGWRSPRPDSPNTALRPFRGYADHMQTPEFQRALDHLLGLAAALPTAIMCAEADPRRCHRLLLADALLARGARVLHVLDPATVQEHTLSPLARIQEDMVTYPVLL